MKNRVNRVNYAEILIRYISIQDYPKNTQDAYQIGSFLLELEDLHEKNNNRDIT